VLAEVAIFSADMVIIMYKNIIITISAENIAFSKGIIRPNFNRYTRTC
jgi:hypothetical protein